MSKHRSEQFRDAYAVVRIDRYLDAVTTDEQRVQVKEVWLRAEEAEAEVDRLNALTADDDGVHYFAQYTRLERDDV